MNIATSYIANSKVYKGRKRICLMRWKLKYFKGIYYYPLAPSLKLLSDYKHNNITFETFHDEMVKQLEKLDSKKILTRLEKFGDNIVLLGIKYDGSFDEANLNECSNIYFLGPKKYEELPNYASHFDVCTIPFLINDITQATSPLKLFEYMAMEKPIVTTNMNECTKYKSVMIANDKEEFVKLVDKAIEMANERDEEYFAELKKESLENTWESKAKVIIDLLEAHE